MNSCSNNHDEVHFNGECPMCLLVSRHERFLTEEREIAEAYKAKWKQADTELQRLYRGKADGEC